MNAIAASRLRMMLAAGKHRLEHKATRSRRRVVSSVPLIRQLDGTYRSAKGYPKPKRNQAFFEELRTRQAEARAADPATFERERQAHRIACNRYWDHIRFERAHSNASKEIAEVLPEDRLERYRDIWQVITQSNLAKRWLIVNAGQVQLYHLRKKQPRVRGVGRAAKLAGF